MDYISQMIPPISFRECNYFGATGSHQFCPPCRFVGSMLVLACHCLRQMFLVLSSGGARAGLAKYRRYGYGSDCVACCVLAKRDGQG